jgi:hypothetical protein
MTDHLAVGLASWIIQDGNYDDFRCGDRAAFALEFDSSTKLEEIGSERTPVRSLVSTGGALYKASGQVVHTADDWWAIDVGTLVFREEVPPRNARLGAWMVGEIYVGIDPFFYFERLGRHPDAPALIYDWEIKKIEMQTAPRIEVQPRLFKRDPALLGWREIEKTNGWQDDGGCADYVHNCRRLEGPARRTRSR